MSLIFRSRYVNTEEIRAAELRLVTNNNVAGKKVTEAFHLVKRQDVFAPSQKPKTFRKYA